jgi:hypothetical protein
MESLPNRKVNVSVEELPLMAFDELINIKTKIEEDLDYIKNQIDHAKVLNKQGIPSDPEWFVRVNHAKRILGRKSQKIQMELSKRRDKMKQHHLRYENTFVTVAKRLLSEDVFSHISEEAKAEIAGV